MVELFNDYEKQFSVLTADITAKIGRIPNMPGEQKRSSVSDVEQKLEEAQELLEQMDLEVRTMPLDDKSRCSGKLKSYKDEVQNCERDLKKAKIAFSDQEIARAELLAGDDGTHSEDQRTRLLDNTEKLERTGRRLDEGYRLCIETEDIGTEILQNLERDRETITKTRDRLRGTETNLSKSSRLLSRMMRRVIQNRIILAFVCLAILGVLGFIIYYSTRTR